ncbi:MAG: hypothetical protein ACREP6_02605 [Candidatus Binataceae bacterium]
MRREVPAERGEKERFLLRTVDEVRGVLAAEADEAETLRTLPASSAAALRDSGLLALKLPAVLGGAEADPITQLKVIEAVSYINSAAGWCLFVGAATLGISGAFLPDSAIGKIFSGERLPAFAGGGGFALGKMTPADGGYRLTGHWSWGSGIRHVDWVTVPARVESGKGAGEVRFCIFPVAQCEIDDNWHVMGLKGTGSCDYSVTDLFVPEDFTHLEPNAASPKRGGPLYRIGLPGFIANENAGFELGVARRALDEIVALAQSKQRGYHKKTPLIQRAVFQRAIGEDDLSLRAARALMIELLEDAWKTVCDGGRIEPRTQAALRSAGSLIMDVSLKAATDAFRYGGSSAIRSSNILQRCLRDLEAAGTHFIISDSSYENYGQFLLGLPQADPMN